MIGNQFLEVPLRTNRNKGESMKRIWLALAVLAATLTLFSCKSGDQPAVTTPAPDPAPADVEPCKDGQTGFKCWLPDRCALVLKKIRSRKKK